MTLSGNVTARGGHPWPLYARIDVAGRPGATVTSRIRSRATTAFTMPANASYDVTYTAQLPGYKVVTKTVAVGRQATRLSNTAEASKVSIA